MPLDIEPNMGLTIANAKFDMLWIQFYNNPSCSARSYISSTEDGTTNGFNYDAWVATIAGSASADAKLYIGLLGGPDATTAAFQDEYLSVSEATTLLTEYYSHAQFGGVMIYEATVADNNGQYYNDIKEILEGCASGGTSTSSTLR